MPGRLSENKTRSLLFSIPSRPTLARFPSPRASGLTLGISKPDRKRLRGRLGLGVIGRNVPDPGSVGSEVRGELHIRGDYSIIACLRRVV